MFSDDIVATHRGMLRLFDRAVGAGEAATDSTPAAEADYKDGHYVGWPEEKAKKTEKSQHSLENALAFRG